MERRTAEKRTRVMNPEAATAELAEHYARILGQQADRQVSAVICTCLRRIPSRLPIQGEDLHAVEELVERLLRLGEVGARDPIGSPRQIDDYIAGRLGEPASGPRSVYRALRAMVGRTALVERLSRQIYALRLCDLLDTSSKVHRALLAETPALYSLPASDTDTAAGASAVRGAAGEADDPHTPRQLSEPLAADPSQQLWVEVARLQEELAAERLARAEVNKRRGAAEAALEEEHRARGEANHRVQVAAARLTKLEQELGLLRGAVDEVRRARDEEHRRGQASTAQFIALEQELGASRGREQMLADSLADAQRELHGVRDAQAADAATVWRLIETNQPQEALAFLAARMHGLNVDERILSVARLIPAENAPVLAVPQPLSLPPTLEPRTGAAPGVPVEQGQVLAVPLVAEPPRTTRTPRARPLMSLTPILDARTEPAVKLSKVGRNDPCPCGSGKKFKRCCGQSA